jgi:hypothetical protein
MADDYPSLLERSGDPHPNELSQQSSSSSYTLIWRRLEEDPEFVLMGDNAPGHHCWYTNSEREKAGITAKVEWLPNSPDFNPPPKKNKKKIEQPVPFRMWRQKTLSLSHGRRWYTSTTPSTEFGC